MSCGKLITKRHFNAVQQLKLTRTLGSPLLNQLTVATFLASANMENHLKTLVKTLDNPRAMASQTVASTFAPGTEAAIPQYGFLL